MELMIVERMRFAIRKVDVVLKIFLELIIVELMRFGLGNDVI